MNAATDPNATKPSRFLLGCVLVPVLFLAVMFSLATIGIAAVALFGGPTNPFAKSPALGVFSLVFEALLAWFFVTVARRLISAFRGEEVPHLFPPLVGVIVGGLVGFGCVATGIAALFGAKLGSGAGGAFGIGVLFLGYAFNRARAWTRHRRSPATEPDP